MFIIPVAAYYKKCPFVSLTISNHPKRQRYDNKLSMFHFPSEWWFTHDQPLSSGRELTNCSVLNKWINTLWINAQAQVTTYPVVPLTLLCIVSSLRVCQSTSTNHNQQKWLTRLPLKLWRCYFQHQVDIYEEIQWNHLWSQHHRFS